MSKIYFTLTGTNHYFGKEQLKVRLKNIVFSTKVVYLLGLRDLRISRNFM